MILILIKVVGKIRWGYTLYMMIMGRVLVVG